ncbi:uncharacterized protein LOC144915860 isoform X2 [Branchiostoma floridae x Branchiostoma belcheri]
MASVRSISLLLLLPLTIILLLAHTAVCKEYFFKKDRQCNVKVERLQPKLGFEVVDVLDWESRGPLDETITIMEDTKMWVTDAPVKRAQFSDMHDDL